MKSDMIEIVSRDKRIPMLSIDGGLHVILFDAIWGSGCDPDELPFKIKPLPPQPFGKYRPFWIPMCLPWSISIPKAG